MRDVGSLVFSGLFLVIFFVLLGACTFAMGNIHWTFFTALFILTTIFGSLSIFAAGEALGFWGRY